MKQLLLMRHAKSSWDADKIKDHERPLAARGERAALIMGRYMRQQGLPIDLALTSPARRALETWALATTQIDGLIPTEADEALYMQGPSAILARIGAVDDGLANLIVVGHNPDLERLAGRLARAGDADLRGKMRGKFPTGALAHLSFEVERWADIADAPGTLIDFTVPKAMV